MKGLLEVRSDLASASAVSLNPAGTSSQPIGLTSKRLADIVLALSGIVLLAPLLIICYVATVIASPGPAFFGHRRVGFKGKHFDCLKFRTMVPDSAERLRNLLESDPAAAAEWIATRKLRNDPRVTAIGAILRKSSLDELPQFWNVLRGEMTLVGPRPPLPYELEQYGPYEMLRLRGKPGLTGTWQVYGRSRVTFQEMIEMDIAYLEQQSIWQDIKLIFLTVPVMIFARGGG